MKQKLFGAAAMVAFILFAASCNEQKQSEFNFDSVTQEVTVSAKVTYDAGVKIDPNNPKSYIIANAEPAQFKKVFISVPYTEYSAGAAAGSKIFEAVTDSAGMFTISIPTKSTGIEGTLRLEEFTAVHQEYDKMGDDGKPVFKVKVYTYSTPVLIGGTPDLDPADPAYVAPRKYKLMPGAFTFPDNNDLVYDGTPVDEEAFDESVTLAGSINLAYETGYHEGAFKAGQDAIVEFVIKYPEWNDPLTFGTTTDQNGNYSVTLPMKSLSQGIAVRSIKVLGVGQNTFKHWTDSTTSMTVAGAYLTDQNTIWEAPAAGPDKQLNGVVSNISYNLGVKNLPFVPYYNGDILANTPQPEGWDPNLIGWAAAKFDESYNKIVTIKGRILMPKNDTYGWGKYEGSTQEIRLTGGIGGAYDNPDPNNPLILNGYTIVTDKNGNFSIDLPVTDETLDQGIIIDPKEANMPFTFTNSKGEQIVLTKGIYARDNNKIIRDTDAEWYELGDYYFVYTPDVNEKPDEWNDYLLGWYVNANYRETVDVKGKMLFAYESSYGVGAYQSLNKPVIIEDNTAGDPVRYFAVMPAADGTFDFKLPVKDKTSVRAINVRFTYPVTNANLYPTAEFKHYYKFGESVAPMLLQGRYTQKHHVYATAQDHTWNNLGTYYMYLAAANVTDIANIPTYHDNLAGWLIVADNNIIRTDHITGYGYAKFAEETGYMEGEMKPGVNKLIPINVPTAAGNTIVYVLTDNTGKFATEIYLKEEGGHPALSVPAVPVPVENFVHYKDAQGNTETVAGNYNGDLVKTKDGEWNDYGTIYYTFNPNPGVAPANWNTAQNIAGWKYQENYEITKTVTGYVKLAKETGYLKGNYQTEKDIPVTIYKDLDGDDFLDGGEPVFIGKTDENGKFTITIPVEKDTDEPKIELDGLNFDYEPGFLHYDAKGKTQVLAGDYNGQQVNDDDAAWNDLGTIYYKFIPDAAPAQWNDYVQHTSGWFYRKDYNINKTITGTVKLAKETGFLKGNYQTEANIPVKINVAGVGTFVAPTEANGTFTITVPVKQANDEPNVAVQNLGMVGAGVGFEYKEFLHYKDATGKTEKVEGRYKGRQIKGATDEWNAAGTTYNAGTVYYMFYPTTPANVEKWNTYAQFIAGWVVKDGYNVTKNVTGSVKLAKETGFLKGNYQAGANIPVLILMDLDNSGLYDDINADGVYNPIDDEPFFVVTTDANGNFSIPVVLEDADDDQHIIVQGLGGGFEFKQFEHYTDATTIKKLDGNYTGEQIKEPDAKWNEAGTLYYNFTPDAAPANWPTHVKFIAGWRYKQGYNVSKTVKGQVKMAQETGFLEGNFSKSAKDIPVKFYLDFNNDGNMDDDEIFVAATDADGKFSIPVFVEKEEDKPTIEPSLTAIQYKEFTHYVDGKGKTTTLTGNYNGQQIKKDAEEAWNPAGTEYDAGTIYYKFTPTVNVPANWASHIQYLAGWFYKKDFETPKTVTGSVLIAKETSYLTGNYQAEKDLPIKINVAGVGTFVAPTDAQGKFSIPILVENDTDEPNVTVTGLGGVETDQDNPFDNHGFAYDQFKHYNDSLGTIKTLAGKYFGTQIDDEAWNNVGVIRYKFYPYNDLNKPDEWDPYTAYLAGWFFMDGYNVEKAVSGDIKIARETGYLAGDFKASAKSRPVKVQVDGDADRTYVVPADADGKFTLNIHVQDTYDEPDVAYVLSAITENSFIDYTNVENKTKKLYGSYAGTIVKETGLAWGKLGTVYYKFTPNIANKPADWDTYKRYIAGWYFRAGYGKAKTVSGKVKLAQETGFWKGNFSGDANGVPVKIQLANGDDNPYYVTTTGANGSWNITVYVKDDDDQPTVTWSHPNLTLAELNDRKFIHWYVPGADSKKNVAGQFVWSTNIKTTEEAADWRKAGTHYYIFNNTDGAEYWTNDLYGWHVWNADQVKTLSVSSMIKKAEEEWKENEAVPKWVPFKNALSRVTVKNGLNSYSFDVAANSSGTFTVEIMQDNIPDDIQLTIVPYAGVSPKAYNVNDITIKHWKDEAKNDGTSRINVVGNYVSANNINNTTFDKNTTTSTESVGYYDYQTNAHSAKMTFTPTNPASPTNWAHYVWNNTQEEYM